MPVISSAIARALASILPKLFNDPNFTIDGKYIRVIGTSYDAASGSEFSNSDSFDVTFLRLSDGIVLSNTEESNFPKREMMLFAYQSSFPDEFSLKGVLDDTIIVDDEELSIIEASPILDILYMFKVQR